jgi:hypothetical protein
MYARYETQEELCIHAEHPVTSPSDAIVNSESYYEKLN